jgi:hypothetical protein
LLIHKRCVRLIDAIPRAVHDESNPEDISKRHFTGMDSIDSLKYLLKGFQQWSEARPPESVRVKEVYESYVSSRLSRGEPVNMSELIHLQDQARQDSTGEIIYRAGRSRRSIAQGLLLDEGGKISIQDANNH